jgi:hypothetical protein
LGKEKESSLVQVLHGQQSQVCGWSWTVAKACIDRRRKTDGCHNGTGWDLSTAHAWELLPWPVGWHTLWCHYSKTCQVHQASKELGTEYGVM